MLLLYILFILGNKKAYSGKERFLIRVSDPWSWYMIFLPSVLPAISTLAPDIM